jgi:hypothetical protein
MLSLKNRVAIFRLAVILSIALCGGSTALAQEVVYDWSSDAKVPESYPTIRRKEKVTFHITHVNDILFSYKLNISQVPIDADDFKNFAAVGSFFKGLSSKAQASLNPTSCDAAAEALATAITEAFEEIKKDKKLPIGYEANPPYKSIPLQQSIDARKTPSGILTTTNAR